MNEKTMVPGAREDGIRSAESVYHDDPAASGDFADQWRDVWPATLVWR